VALVEIKHLTYQYPGTDTPVLKDVNLTVEQGEFVGVVGPTSAGNGLGECERCNYTKEAPGCGLARATKTVCTQLNS